jgi:hypothetical protein
MSRSKRHSRRSSSSGVISEVKDMVAVSKVGVSSSLKLWKLSFLFLVLSIILLIVVLTMPGSYYTNRNSDIAKAADILNFVGVWLGILVWIYRVAYKMPVLKHWIFGFILAVVIPPLIMYIANPDMSQPPPSQQLLNVLRFK